MKVNNSSFLSNVMGYGSKAMGAVTKTKPIKWLGNQFQKNPEKALACSTVGSIIVKDGISCAKYTSQSFHNTEIPDERRNFVTAMDLSNGFLMILAQIGMFALMRKCSEPLFDKMFKKSFNEKTLSNLATKLRKDDHSIRKLVFNKEAAKVRKDALDLFRFVADIAAATIIGKRVIVPFIATPLANVVKGKIDVMFPSNKADGANGDEVKSNDKNQTAQVEDAAKTKETKDA